ncbi:MAG TPA: hypothetical protein VHU86_12040 [Solirubrobacterales bacterium]|jgi:hypothetical protein|nr:hypothetical protein [Solirubrobacterales bacterium]
MNATSKRTTPIPPRRRLPRSLAGLLVAAVALAVAAGSALAFQSLPPSAQVNDDPAAGIDPSNSVSGADPANADVVGGALTAGKVAVPWAVFRQQQGGGAHDQAFARSFAGGAWTTRGSGTVGGRSSASPTFSGSLNFDQGQDAEAPAIDFAGAGRTVPWASWYETTSGAGFGPENVFASRFDNSGDANQGKWIFGGQGRDTGGGSVPIPSLNIHTNQSAENPSLAGGSTADPAKPAPWVAWQETTTAPVSGKDQIFVERSLGPGMANCNGVTPAGVPVSGNVPAIGGICWQETGIGRVAGATDPSLNVDPTRNGEEPEIAFAGNNDSVPWVVWHESGISASGLLENELVFAAKGGADGAAIGGFHWEAVGSQLSGKLDTTGTHGFGKCGESTASEGACSLNDSSTEDAADPRLTAGTMSPGTPTVPWVTWDEIQGGVRRIFVSRLVGSGAGAHFEVANGGKALSAGSGDATRPDIAFSGNAPHVSWREDVGGGVERAFLGHFVDAANPTFVLDESDVTLTPTAQADVRVPISSSCAATPFNGDGAACQGGAIGTPFFLFTAGTSPRGLFGGASQPAVPDTAAASNLSPSGATLNGSVDPVGAAVNVSFEYGPTTAYGAVAAAGSTGVANSPTLFTAQLTGLPAATTIHYRAVAVSDFGTFVGADRTFTTPAPPSPAKGTARAKVFPAKASGSRAGVKVSCPEADASGCRLTLKLTVTEHLRGHRVIAISAAAKHGRTRKTLLVGSGTATLKGGEVKVVQVSLNRKGKKLLAGHSPLKVRLQVFQKGIEAAISTQTVTFRSRPKHRGTRRQLTRGAGPSPRW